MSWSTLQTCFWATSFYVCCIICMFDYLVQTLNNPTFIRCMTTFSVLWTHIEVQDSTYLFRTIRLSIFSKKPHLTSVSKKPGQTTVVIQYYSLSRFFWNRRYTFIPIYIYICFCTIWKFWFQIQQFLVDFPFKRLTLGLMVIEFGYHWCNYLLKGSFSPTYSGV